jgi:SAM-dependent methyltransferase
LGCFYGQRRERFFQDLELPTFEKLVKLKQGEHMLDLATGNGLVAQHLAALGGEVTATDASTQMLEFAKNRMTEDEASKSTYQIVDVTNTEELNSLAHEAQKVRTSLQLRSTPLILLLTGDAKRHGFDVITLNMAIMDIATIEPLATNLPKLLKQDGR